MMRSMTRAQVNLVGRLRRELDLAQGEAFKFKEQIDDLKARVALPIPMLIWCPECGERHVDGIAKDGTDWSKRAHHTHSCQFCGHTFRVAIVATVGVQFLPGFKNDDAR